MIKNPNENIADFCVVSLQQRVLIFKTSAYLEQLKIAIVDYLDHWMILDNKTVKGNERGLNDAIYWWIRGLNLSIHRICNEKNLKLVVFYTDSPDVTVNQFLLDVNRMDKKLKRAIKKEFGCNFVETTNKKITFDVINTKFQAINCCEVYENERIFLEKNFFTR